MKQTHSYCSCVNNLLSTCPARVICGVPVQKRLCLRHVLVVYIVKTSGTKSPPENIAFVWSCTKLCASVQRGFSKTHSVSHSFPFSFSFFLHVSFLGFWLHGSGKLIITAPVCSNKNKFSRIELYYIYLSLNSCQFTHAEMDFQPPTRPTGPPVFPGAKSASKKAGYRRLSLSPGSPG